MDQGCLKSFTGLVLVLSALAGCGNEPAKTNQAGMPPPEVGIVTVEPKPLALTTELPGRLEASRVAEVRARAAGIVLKRVFEEGSLVKAGDVLYQIDPAPLQAALSSAKAQLVRAQANLKQAQVKAQRYAPLVKTNAISKQDYDDAIAARDLAAADVTTAQAAIETAQLELGYATVNAPISGRIGRALVTEGALVGQGEATPMAIIQQTDPIYANLTQSSAELLDLQRAFASGQLQRLPSGEARVTLITEDGREYPQPGRLLFSDISVDPGTGAVIVRAEIPNPDHFLLPGMYVRARLQQTAASPTITVPQQAVSRSAQGAYVMVVDKDGKAAPRPIRTGRVHEGSWIVNDGLQAGDRVIVDGLQKAPPGTPVKPVPWQNPLQQPAKPGTAGTASNETAPDAQAR
jgi:membrane fusion protein (multidrug efflux system)